MPNIENYKFTGNEKFNIKKFKTNDKGEFETREDALSQFVSNWFKGNGCFFYFWS